MCERLKLRYCDSHYRGTIVAILLRMMIVARPIDSGAAGARLRSVAVIARRAMAAFRKTIKVGRTAVLSAGKAGIYTWHSDHRSESDGYECRCRQLSLNLEAVPFFAVDEAICFRVVDNQLGLRVPADLATQADCNAG